MSDGQKSQVTVIKRSVINSHESLRSHQSFLNSDQKHLTPLTGALFRMKGSLSVTGTQIMSTS